MPLFDGIEQFENVSPALQWAIFIVAVLIVIMTIVSLVISAWLFIRYIRFNRKMNSRNLCGHDAARQILDANGLQHIKVSTFGSMLFGNSYSHYFKKVRLRRLTTKKPSITSLAMGAEKSALAVLDKEGDPDMKARVRLTPLVYFGPFAFIPIVLIGVLLDLFLFNATGVATTVAIFLGFAFYIVSIVLSVMTLKTEKKAQVRACEILKQENMATDEEIDMMKELFKLYNIQYINDIILELLELILKVLQFVAQMQGNSSSSNN